MRKQTQGLHAVVAWGLGLALVSCGGRAGVQNPAQALLVVGQAVGATSGLRFNADPNTAINSMSPGASLRSGATPMMTQLRSNRLAGGTSGCGYTSTPVYASRVDADSDGIAQEMTWTYFYDSKACGVTDSSSSSTFQGTFVERDSDDTKKWYVGGFDDSWSYTGTYSFPGGTSDGKTYPASSFTYKGKGTYKSIPSATSFDTVGDYLGTQNWSAGGKTGSFEYMGVFKHTITPDSLVDSDAWKKGKASFSGTWTYTGTFPDEGEGQRSGTTNSNGTVDVTFTASSKDLVYDNTCSNYWKTGSFFYDMGGHVFEYRYDCTSVKYFYDGVEYDPTKK